MLRYTRNDDKKTKKMKRNDIIIIIASVLVTFLFYKQILGINWLIFSVFAIAVFAYQAKEKIKNIAWIISAAGTLITGFFVYYYGTPLPFIANIVSLVTLGGVSLHPDSSFIISWMHSAYSTLAGIPYMVHDFIEKRTSKNENKPKEKSNIFTKILLLIFPLIIVGVFFFLYKGASPIFENFTKNIKLDFISLPLVRFFILAFIIMYGYLIQRYIPFFYKKDKETSSNLAEISEEQREKGFFAKILSIANERYIGFAILIMLNVLLGIVNSLDVFYLWKPNQSLPEGMDFADYLHNSTWMLVASIILAILIIMFIFRGYLNFDKKSKWLKVLAYVWIAQNVILAITTIMKNNMYVEAYGLTHKRIGVYAYLVLAFIGLLTTAYKIFAKKNNVFLFRINSWLFYGVLVLSTLFNWDMLITKTNIAVSKSPDTLIDLDQHYLVNRSFINTSALYQYYADSTIAGYYEHEMSSKLYELLNDDATTGWQSACYWRNKNLKEIEVLNEQGKITSVNLSGRYNNEDFSFMQAISNAKEVNYSNNYLYNNLTQLVGFEKVEELHLSNCQITKLDSLPEFTGLTYLSLSGNQINDFSSLERTPNLEYLNIANTGYYADEKTLPELPKLTSINFSRARWHDWSFLKQFPNLEEIEYSGSCDNNNYVNDMPYLPNIKVFNITSNSCTKTGYDVLQMAMDSMPNLEVLNASNIGMKASNWFEKEDVEVFPNLKELNVSNCILPGMKQFTKFKNLETLNISNNNIYTVVDIEQLKKLTTLSASDNEMNSLQFLDSAEVLETVYLSSNRVESFAGIDTNTTVKYLNLNYNSVKSLEGIQHLTNVESLYLENNQIKDIKPLLRLKNVKNLNIRGNKIEDFTPLLEMKSLAYLVLGESTKKFRDELRDAIPGIEIVYYDAEEEEAHAYEEVKDYKY